MRHTTAKLTCEVSMKTMLLIFLVASLLPSANAAEKTCSAGWFHYSYVLCKSEPVPDDPNAFYIVPDASCGFSSYQFWRKEEVIGEDGSRNGWSDAICLSADDLAGESKKVERLRKMLKNFEFLLSTNYKTDNKQMVYYKHYSWARVIVPLILESIELSQSIPADELNGADQIYLIKMKAELSQEATRLWTDVNDENELEGLDLAAIRIRIEKIIGPIGNSESVMADLQKALDEQNTNLIHKLGNLYPEGLVKFRESLKKVWYEFDSGLMVAVLFPINKLMVSADQLPALESRIQAMIQTDISNESNRYYSFHMAQSYIKSQIQYIRELQARSARLLALRVRVKSEKIELPLFIETLKSSSSLSEGQLKAIEEEFLQLKSEEQAQDDLINTLIDSQLKTIARRISNSESKMIEVITTVKDHAHPSMYALLDGYLALYQMEPERVVSSLHTATAEMATSNTANSVKAAINDLVDSAALAVDDLENVRVSIEEFQKNVEAGYYSAADVVASTLNEPKASANPLLISILQSAVAEVEDKVSAGIALQIALAELVQDSFIDFKNALKSVPSMKAK